MLKICSKHKFIENKEYNAIFCFGAGRWSRFVGEVFANTAILDKITGFIDNDKSREGTFVSIGNSQYKVYAPSILDQYHTERTAIIISCMQEKEILEQLSKAPRWSLFDVYYIKYFELADREEEAMKKEIPENLRLVEKPVIPKVIHYCWFGGKPIPDQNKLWMESWHRFCPDYEIKEWNESNYDITKNKYMYQAYEKKKWGFVSDYARLDIIYNFGGIYLDTDVEVIASLDELLYQKGFAGFERKEVVASGLGFGAVPHLPIIMEMMELYKDKCFINEDGSLNLTGCPVLQTDILLRHGLKQNGEYQIVDGLTIFPEKMFCGKSTYLRRILLKPYSRSIHHYDGSWLGEEARKLYAEKEAIITKYQERCAEV